MRDPQLSRDLCDGLARRLHQSHRFLFEFKARRLFEPCPFWVPFSSLIESTSALGTLSNRGKIIHPRRAPRHPVICKTSKKREKGQSNGFALSFADLCSSFELVFLALSLHRCGS